MLALSGCHSLFDRHFQTVVAPEEFVVGRREAWGSEQPQVARLIGSCAQTLLDFRVCQVPADGIGIPACLHSQLIQEAGVRDVLTLAEPGMENGPTEGR